MKPTIGRIIHVTATRDQTLRAGMPYPCRAAIVTAFDLDRIWATVFSIAAGTHSAVLIDPSSWHDPRECPNG